MNGKDLREEEPCGTSFGPVPICKTELVEQQAAISEVLRAVADSPHDLQPIFDTILINATRLCRATFGAFIVFEEKGFRTVARRGPPNPVYAERVPLGLVHPIHPGHFFAQLIESASPNSCNCGKDSRRAVD
jgi:hypothetical protein